MTGHAFAARLAVATGLCFGACGESPAPSAAPGVPATPSLVGAWKSTEYMSQMGPSTMSWTFGADGTYPMAMAFRAMPGVPLKSQGTYRATQDRLVVEGAGKSSEYALAWKDGDLVLTERNGDRYVLSRAPSK